MVSDMKGQKTIGGRELRRGTPEEKLTPGESLIIHKQGGRIFELRRTDGGGKSLVKQLDELFNEIPKSGKHIRTDLSRMIVEERE